MIDMAEFYTLIGIGVVYLLAMIAYDRMGASKKKKQ